MTNIYMEMPALGGAVCGVFAAGENIPADLANLEWQKYQAFIAGGGAALPFDPALEWKDGAWVPNEAKRAAYLSAVKASANERITAYAEAKRKEIAGTQDDGEIAGWHNKLRIAQAIVAGNATDADKAAFEGEIAARAIPGETLDIFVQKVLKSAMFYAKAAGIIDGLKRKAQDDVAAAKTPEAVEAVITTMRQKAEAAHAELAKAQV
ncbi:hypothetical protein [Pandoraea apista]|uniref:hypothetical protein n=1 Tax=Pandoraea apista TaxID=93218 RepID=UPI000F67BF67|nr:hypothetical protein [Pandoraea apista]RRW87968.1 hypothetical protein EGJ54_25080 [Pandoraea apista]RRW96726.1 hypothetical protein EGJ56_25020 [Pandoraea apista]